MKENTKTLTYEQLMASLAELRESQNQTDEQMKRTDEKLEALFKRTDEKLEALGIRVGGITENMGNHAEQYFQNALEENLSFGGIKYDVMQPNMSYKGKGINAEFDIFLKNGKSVAIIEVKSRIHPKFIKEIAEEKTAQFRKYFPEYKDYDLYLGVAGFSFSKKVEEEAKKYGVGIIRQVGNSVEIDDKQLKAY